MKSSGLKPQEQSELNYIEQLIKLNWSQEQILFNALNGLEGMAKSRRKKKILKLINLANNKGN